MTVVPIRSKADVLDGKRAQVKAQNRRIILDAARRVFSELGYGGAKVRDIIRATPLASGTFYNYFRTKDEVLQALCDDAASQFTPAIREARLKAKSPEAFFLATFSIFFAFVAERRKLAPLMPQETTALAAAGLKDDIHAAIARGLLPDINPQLLTATTAALAISLADMLDIFSSAEAAARSATAFVLPGLSALTTDQQQLAVNY